MVRARLAATAVLLALVLASQSACKGPKGNSSVGVFDVGPKGGPPAHAPAHGYRAKHKYVYYPTAGVYFDLDRKVYFYWNTVEWTVTATLPSSIEIRVGEGITLELETDRPYLVDHPGRGKSGASGKPGKAKHKK